MTERFRTQLAKQLGFIERSCRLFDEGHTDEAIRIATSVRVIVHDTKSSTSLLKHLGRQGTRLIDTCPPMMAGAIMFHGMGMHHISGSGGRFVPNLDKTPFAQPRPAAEWWEQVVMALGPAARLSRRDIVLGAANKDGGAHVDAELTPQYGALATTGSTGAYVVKRNDGSELVGAIPDAHLVALRQIGYEILHSPELQLLADDVNEQGHR